jgi:hypothetical protein
LLKWADFYWGNNDDGMQADYRLKFIRLLEDYEEAQDFNQMVYDFLSE